MPPLGIEQQAVVNGEQAAVNTQIAVAVEPQAAEAGGVRDQSRGTQGLGRQRRGLGGTGAEHIEQPAIGEAQTGGGAEVQRLDVAETAGPGQMDAAGRQPEQVGGATETDRLVDEAAEGIHHPHHQVAQPVGLNRDPRDAAAGVEGGEAMEQVAAGLGATADGTGSALAGAATVDERAQAAAPAGRRDLAGPGTEIAQHQQGQAQTGQPQKAGRNGTGQAGPGRSTRAPGDGALTGVRGGHRLDHGRALMQNRTETYGRPSRMPSRVATATGSGSRRVGGASQLNPASPSRFDTARRALPAQPWLPTQPSAATARMAALARSPA